MSSSSVTCFCCWVSAGSAIAKAEQAKKTLIWPVEDVVLPLLIVLVGFLFAIPYVIMQLKAGGELAAVLFAGRENAFEIGAIVLSAITAVSNRPPQSAATTRFSWWFCVIIYPLVASAWGLVPNVVVFAGVSFIFCNKKTRRVGTRRVS